MAGENVGREAYEILRTILRFRQGRQAAPLVSV